MKKALVVILLLLAILSGCVTEPAPTTVPTLPPETTIPTTVPTTPPETTQPATLPPETEPSYNKAALSPDLLQATGFEIFAFDGYHSFLYHHSGTDSTVILPDLGLTLTLPETWVGNVDIFRTELNYTPDTDISEAEWLITFVDRSVVDAHLELIGYQRGELLTNDFIYLPWDMQFMVKAWPKSVFSGSIESYLAEDYAQYWFYLGENDLYYFLGSTRDMNYDGYRDQPQTLGSPCGNMDVYFAGLELWKALGSEAYYGLVSRLPADKDLVRDTVAISNPWVP